VTLLLAHIKKVACDSGLAYASGFAAQTWHGLRLGPGPHRANDRVEFRICKNLESKAAEPLRRRQNNFLARSIQRVLQHCRQDRNHSCLAHHTCPSKSQQTQSRLAQAHAKQVLTWTTVRPRGWPCEASGWTRTTKDVNLKQVLNLTDGVCVCVHCSRAALPLLPAKVSIFKGWRLISH
jgi:hypothetical protein